MTEKQFEREKRYQIILAIARKMVAAGVITNADFHEIESMMREKYRPIFYALDLKFA